MKRAPRGRGGLRELLRGDRHEERRTSRPSPRARSATPSNQRVFLDRVRDETASRCASSAARRRPTTATSPRSTRRPSPTAPCSTSAAARCSSSRSSSRHPGRLGSWPLGAVRMTEHFLAEDDPPTKKARKAMRAHVRESLEQEADWLPRTGRQLVGIGGTMRNLASAIQVEAGHPSLGGVQGFEITPRRARRPRRAARRPCRPTSAATSRASSTPAPTSSSPARWSSRWCSSTAASTRSRSPRPACARASSSASCSTATRRCSTTCAPRASPTSRRATASAPSTPRTSRASRSPIFDELAAPACTRAIAGSASCCSRPCVLHDIGMSVDYDDHHKHSRYLILNAGLPGFDPREVALVAQAARYHRKGMPDFGELPSLAEEGDADRLDRLVDPAPARRGPRAQPRSERPRRPRRGRQRHDLPRARVRGQRRGRALGGAARGRALRSRVRARPEGRGDV